MFSRLCSQTLHFHAPSFLVDTAKLLPHSFPESTIMVCCRCTARSCHAMRIVGPRFNRITTRRYVAYRRVCPSSDPTMAMPQDPVYSDLKNSSTYVHQDAKLQNLASLSFHSPLCTVAHLFSLFLMDFASHLVQFWHPQDICQSTRFYRYNLQHAKDRFAPSFMSEPCIHMGLVPLRPISHTLIGLNQTPGSLISLSSFAPPFAILSLALSRKLLTLARSFFILGTSSHSLLDHLVGLLWAGTPSAVLQNVAGQCAVTHIACLRSLIRRILGHDAQQPHIKLMSSTVRFLVSLRPHPVCLTKTSTKPAKSLQHPRAHRNNFVDSKPHVAGTNEKEDATTLRK